MPASDHVLILAALAFEAHPIARAIGLRFDSRTSATRGNVRLAIVGPRAGRLASLAPPSGCRAVVMAGLAGGLAPDVARGDLVVDERGDPRRATTGRRGGIATLATLASTPAEKASLHRSTGALVVDMENAIARDWSRCHALPFVGLRVVSDTASEPLDPATVRIVDDDGFLRPGRLVGELLRRPAFAATLWRLRSTRVAVATLAESVRLFVDAIDVG